jgi:hypothetical protein
MQRKSFSFLRPAGLAILLTLASVHVDAQTVFVPGGTVGTSTNGNVGIGTNAPGSHCLEVITSATGNDIAVRGAIGRPSGDNYAFAGYASGAGANSNNGGLFYASGATINRGVYIYNVAAGANNFALYSESAAQSYFAGNVGIGTTSPSAKLDVRGEVWVGGSAAPTLRLRDGASEYATMRIFSGDLAFEVANNERMRIAAGGNVGIGTTSPTYPLTVNGTVRAKEVIVDTGWSDYVFDPDYRLAPLAEVERQIKTEKHLPGIPTAAEVMATGISVGDMQARLLRKIEELTLHQIAQEKEIAALKTANTRLESQVELMSRR